MPWDPFGLLEISERRNSKVNGLDSVLRVKVNINELNNQVENQKDHSKCLDSPAFELNHVTWKIRTCRRHEVVSNEADKIDILLVSIFSGQTAAWSCQAKANFKLLPAEGQTPIEDELGFYNFNGVSPSKGIDGITIWKNFTKEYVIEDEATILVAISTKPPNRAAGLDQTSIKFQMRVKQLSNFTDQFSNEVIVRGIRWKVLATSQNDHFAVFVYANEDDMNYDLSWKVSATFQLVSPDGSVTVPRKFSDVPFRWTNSSWGFAQFIKWSDLFNSHKEFVVRDATILQVELAAGEPETI